MGTCCGNNRQVSDQSIYCIGLEGTSIIEYNIQKNAFFLHFLKTQVAGLAKIIEFFPGKILIVGGFKRLKNRLGEPVSEVWVFDKEHGIVAKSSLPQSRTGHCLISSFGSVYLISGVISHIQPTQDCYKYDYISDNWTQISSISKPRVLAAGCSIDNFLYVTGGNPGNSLQNYRDIEKYNILTNNWELLELKLPVDIWRHTCLPHKNGIIVFGGNGNRNFNLDCFKVDFANNIITQHTWLTQGCEFHGCNYGDYDKVYAFDTSNCKLVWVYSQGKWSSRLRTLSMPNRNSL